MNAKPFMLLLAAIMVLGGGLGGAFAGGIALGKSQGEESAQSTLPAQSPSSPNQSPSGQISPEQLEQFRQRIQSGEFNPQDLDQFGQGQFGQRFAGRAGLTGTVETIEGNTVTINTSQGPLQATIGGETTIQMFTEGGLEDLTMGLQVTVVGQRGEDGTVAARSILITPEGLGGPFGQPSQQEQQSP